MHHRQLQLESHDVRQFQNQRVFSESDRCEHYAEGNLFGCEAQGKDQCQRKHLLSDGQILLILVYRHYANFSKLIKIKELYKNSSKTKAGIPENGIPAFFL